MDTNNGSEITFGTFLSVLLVALLFSVLQGAMLFSIISCENDNVLIGTGTNDGDMSRIILYKNDVKYCATIKWTSILKDGVKCEVHQNDILKESVLKGVITLKEVFIPDED
ncbi:hypothetical protein [Winogradskyella endarachnes]|uniref:Uncharacterized protein n=1 Tax=Winogradskyella endarachnes TaxID=2681965 RepID=A0A6L6U8Y4_9FLAO|nr:hypothetical protein [Winogradskyella endarachnes]MUU78638.1 hypothetical protein [Winogradskyella endarachnes]